MISIEKLRDDLLYCIDVLAVPDCDLRSLVICLNPNFIKGSDNQVKECVRSELNNLISEGIITESKHRTMVYNKVNYSKTFVVYSIKNTSKS